MKWILRPTPAFVSITVLASLAAACDGGSRDASPVDSKSRTEIVAVKEASTNADTAEVEKGTVGAHAVAAGTTAREPAPLVNVASDANARARVASSETILQDAGPDALGVKRLVVTQGIENREPLPLTSVDPGAPFVAFLEAQNPGPEDMKVFVTFEHESGTEVGFVGLDVPKKSPRYRTWARTHNVKKPGTWTAVVKTSEGVELARQSFTVNAS